MYNYLPYDLMSSKMAKELTIHTEPPTLYSIMESIVNFDREDPIKIKDLAKYSKEKIFNFEYPISELFNKDEFEELFLKHYLFRRINYDTMTSFRLHLEIKLNEIMPKYNKMIEGFSLINFDGSVEKHKRTVEDERNNTSTGETSGETSSEDSSTLDSRNSDTPQNLLNDIKNGSYVTEFSYNENSSSANSTTSTESSSNSRDIGTLEENILISRGDSIEEYKKFLEVIDNIYSMIFRECDDLFYGIV